MFEANSPLQLFNYLLHKHTTSCFVGVGRSQAVNLLASAYACSRKDTLVYLSIRQTYKLFLDSALITSFNKHFFVWGCGHGSNHTHHLILSRNVNGLENYFSYPPYQLLILSSLSNSWRNYEDNKFYCYTGHIIYFCSSVWVFLVCYM